MSANKKYLLLHGRFDSWAETYDKSLITYWNRHIQRKVFKEISDNSSILDLACGTGHFLLMSSELKNVTLCGVDGSKEMIKQAKAKLGDEFDLRHAFAENTTFEDDKFDYVVCTTAFHHFPDPVASIQEMKRISKNKGRIIIADLNFLPLCIGNRVLQRIEEDFVSMYSKSDFKKFAKNIGLNVVKQRRVGLFGLMHVLEKP